jgi:hypothetical protein
VPLFPFDEGRYQGRGIWCTGFGINSCGEPQGSLTQLRFGAPMVEASSNTTLTLGELNGRIPDSGDSGGPCWSMFESETNPLSVLGIVSSSAYCALQENGNTWAESPPQFRTWVRSQIANRKGTSTYAFAGPSEIAWWGAYNPPGNTTNWTVQNGRLSETSDAGGTEPDGPMRFSILEIHDNADISVKVRSSDNDGAGIVFRYVDPENYYFFYVRPQLHIARFYKRRRGGFIAYPSGTTLIQFSSTADTTLKVELRDATFRGFINGTQVAAATDGEFPTGYAGIYKWKLAEASFDDFTIVAKIPQNSLDWPISP